MTPAYFDRNGKPMVLLEWARKLEDREYARVAEDFLDESGNVRVRVSTVWLGLNHAHRPGVCHIFETMIFGGEFDSWCERYPNVGEAVRVHDRILDRLKRRLSPAEDGSLSP